MSKIVKLAAATAVVAASVLAGSLVSAGITNQANGGNQNQNKSSSSKAPVEDINPITDEIKQVAEQFDYDVDPTSVIMKEQEEWDYTVSELSSVPYDKNRSDHDLIYYFEGAYSEGYQGDYSPTYCYLYLWDDGFFGGTSGKENVRGYWFNSSLANGTDEETGEDIADCLTMVSNLTHFESITTLPKQGFYKYEAYMFLDMGKVWGQGSNGRSVIMNGYPYYPEVAMFIDTHGEETLKCEVGKNADISAWTPSRVLKNLDYSAIFVQTDVKWEATNGAISIEYVDGQKNRGISSITANFTEAGTQTITASWNGLSASVDVIVE